MRKTTILNLLNIEKTMQIIASVSLAGMAFVTGTDVCMRCLLNFPLSGSEEIVSTLCILMVGFSLPYTHTEKSHIAVEMITRKLSRQTQHVVTVSTNTITLLLTVAVTWWLISYAYKQIEYGEISMNLGLPICITIVLLAIGFLTYSLRLMVDIFGLIQRHDKA